MKADLPVTVAWCNDPKVSAELAGFFAGNITPEYISHSELQGPRALDVDRWTPDLVQVFAREIEDRITKTRGQVDTSANSYLVLSARQDSRLIGLGCVSFFPGAPTPYAVVEDIIVAQESRSQGIGKIILDWITREAEGLSYARLFLESSVRNHCAHHFFEREGFATCSIVMMKSLAPSG